MLHTNKKQVGGGGDKKIIDHYNRVYCTHHKDWYKRHRCNGRNGQKIESESEKD